MDAELKQMDKQGAARRAGQDIKNAAKAVGNLPKNFMNQVKAQIHKLDEKDEARRKGFMSEPGFRKQSFHNLKMAILYGSAATMKLTLVPWMMVIRHFSKEKDRRIRNELVSEIEAEIRICDEKINDANSEGKKQEKYELMRIREKLNRELLRVKYNSKYI